MIVVDVSVFAKLFLDEPDHDQAEALFSHALEAELPLVAPSLLLYEALSIGLRHGVPFEAIMGLLGRLRVARLEISEPAESDLLLAERIATTGNKAAGYAGSQDSIYHAMAIQRGGMFVTADARHVAKAGHFGHVTLLADWRPG
ncbi:type II toxin-antitoxin system VapC family toxin [Mesorhizobium sp. LHD-90]|uniref:type II toxin-antitoxin system VapC family toxin n=1 Tax=Mesorhizobium sp. LHD-90 TaxID=3071414 RepID=UPI0027DF7B41|nr:type II toxin-antitoxin system VapC family toxin [Mesorhizobium sp. LHD-90]MDQ6436980.1 type II toxin-antitoxin system VapC family toxin [Mesorhizobium sp. LHD-90]